MHNPAVLVTLTAVLAALPGTHGFYTKNSPVLQLNARNYDKLITKSNYTSIVEFYAPWCGHCQNLKPAYEKAARNLEGLVKVAAVDCDEDANKGLCSSLGIKGFPTLKVVRPAKKGGHPVVEDYNGPRTANGIVDAVVKRINNHVLRVTDKDIEKFLGGDKPKAILFSEKGTTSALLKSLAIDFLDVITVGQVRENQKETVEKYGIDKFPTLLLFPGEGEEPIVYEGELNKKDMLEFLSQAGEPNPDPAPEKGKAKNKTEKKEKKQQKKGKKPAKPAKPVEEESSAEPEEPETSTTETTETATQHAAPTDVPIATITTQEELVENCLTKKSHTCVLVFAPSEGSEDGQKAVSSLSHLNAKYLQGKRHLFPFFSIPSDSEAASTLPKRLELDGEVNMIAINNRRSWWRQYGGDYSLKSVEGWIDAIRMGEGSKNKLPKDVLGATAEEPVPEATQATDPEPEIETEDAEAEAETKIPEPEVEEEVTEAEAEAETASPEPEAEAEAEAPGTEEETEPIKSDAEVPEAEPVVETEKVSEPEVEDDAPKTEEKIVHEEL